MPSEVKLFDLYSVMSKGVKLLETLESRDRKRKPVDYTRQIKSIDSRLLELSKSVSTLASLGKSNSIDRQVRSIEKSLDELVRDFKSYVQSASSSQSNLVRSISKSVDDLRKSSKANDYSSVLDRIDKSLQSISSKVQSSNSINDYSDQFSQVIRKLDQLDGSSKMGTVVLPDYNSDLVGLSRAVDDLGIPEGFSSIHSDLSGLTTVVSDKLSDTNGILGDILRAHNRVASSTDGSIGTIKTAFTSLNLSLGALSSELSGIRQVISSLPDVLSNDSQSVSSSTSTTEDVGTAVLGIPRQLNEVIRLLTLIEGYTSLLPGISSGTSRGQSKSVEVGGAILKTSRNHSSILGQLGRTLSAGFKSLLVGLTNLGTRFLSTATSRIESEWNRLEDSGINDIARDYGLYSRTGDPRYGNTASTVSEDQRSTIRQMWIDNEYGFKALEYQIRTFPEQRKLLVDMTKTVIDMGYNTRHAVDLTTSSIMKWVDRLPTINVASQKWNELLVRQGKSSDSILETIEQASHKYFVTPEMITEVGDRYANMLRFVTSGTTQYTNAINKLAKVTAQQADRMIDTQKMLTGYDALQSSGWESFHGDSYQALLQLGINPYEYDMLDPADAATILEDAMRDRLGAAGVTADDGLSMAERAKIRQLIDTGFGSLGYSSIEDIASILPGWSNNNLAGTQGSYTSNPNEDLSATLEAFGNKFINDFSEKYKLDAQEYYQTYADSWIYQKASNEKWNELIHDSLLNDTVDNLLRTVDKYTWGTLSVSETINSTLSLLTSWIIGGGLLKGFTSLLSRGGGFIRQLFGRAGGAGAGGAGAGGIRGALGSAGNFLRTSLGKGGIASGGATAATAAIAGTASIAGGLFLGARDARSIIGRGSEVLGRDDISLGDKVNLGISGFLGGNHGGVTDSNSSGLEKAGNVLGNAGKGALIGAGIGSFIPVVGTAVGAGIGGAIGGIGGLIGGENIARFVDNAKETIGNGLSIAGGWISDRAKDFTNFVSSGLENGRQLGKNLVDGLSEGIEKDDSLLEKASKVSSNILGGFKNLFGIKSHSTVMQGIGQKIVNGLSNGISEASLALPQVIGRTTGLIVDGVSAMASQVEKTASNMWGRLTSGASGLVTNVFGESAGKTIESGMNKVGSITSKAWNAGKKFVSDPLGTTKEALGNLKDWAGGLFSGAKFANGMVNVPVDNYPALLHEGERVLTKSEAKEYNQSVEGRSKSISGLLDEQSHHHDYIVDYNTRTEEDLKKYRSNRDAEIDSDNDTKNKLLKLLDSNNRQTGNKLNRALFDIYQVTKDYGRVQFEATRILGRALDTTNSRLSSILRKLGGPAYGTGSTMTAMNSLGKMEGQIGGDRLSSMSDLGEEGQLGAGGGPIGSPMINSSGDYGSGIHMKLNRPSTVTAEALNKAIDEIAPKNSALRGMGEAFIQAQNASGIHAIDLLSQAALESGWGTSKYARERYNFFGWGAYDSNPDNAWSFQNAGAGITKVANMISKNYVQKGQDSWYLMEDREGKFNSHQYATDPKYEYKLSQIRDKISQKVPTGYYKIGIDRVPYDSQVAELHRDEKVLSAPNARYYDLMDESAMVTLSNVMMDYQRVPDRVDEIVDAIYAVKSAIESGFNSLRESRKTSTASYSIPSRVPQVPQAPKTSLLSY